MVIINETHSYLLIEGHPILTAFAQGFSLAIAQRLLITIAVIGRSEDKAAWLGFGFGILESLGIILPIAPMYSLVIFKGHTLYQLYRKSLNSLFQSASAMILSKASVLKIAILILVQGIGVSILILDSMGEITFLSKISNFAWLGILSVPISSLIKKE